MSQSSAFATLNLSPAMLDNLQQLGYQSMTAIQQVSLPAILQGQDVIAQAKTGSGKTAAFGLGALQQLNPRYFGCQALVLCPTRELADQVAKELRRLARAQDNIKILTLCGGVAFGPQVGSLEHGAHIIVGTPGRIQDHLRKGTVSFNGLKTLVLDEADRMLDMGFFETMQEIIQAIPSKRQTLLFSATYPAGIQQLAAEFLRQPVMIKVESQHQASQIQQYFYEVQPEQRLTAVEQLLWHYRPDSCVAFCQTKQQCNELVAHLEQQGIAAVALHGDLEQRDRDKVLTLFSSRCTRVLVATDVAARGLDIDDLPMVLNVELARDPEVHTHRIGRTGRAGASGIAVSLVTPKESYRATAIEAQQSEPLSWYSLAALKPNYQDYTPAMQCLNIGAGRKHKLRPGDILGALTGDAGLAGAQVGKISLFDHQAYVAVERAVARKALQRLQEGKIKGRNLPVRFVS